jgi:hypothetical protein
MSTEILFLFFLVLSLCIISYAFIELGDQCAKMIEATHLQTLEIENVIVAQTNHLTSAIYHQTRELRDYAKMIEATHLQTHKIDNVMIDIDKG